MSDLTPTLDARIDALVRPIADATSGFIFHAIPIAGAEVPLIVAWLIGGGVFFTLYLGFINIRGFGHALALVRGRHRNPDDPGEISQFQALTAAVSGTVGIGNIAGVAVAISVGGPGATFWLIVAGFLGMSTKLAECTLGVKYRELQDGVVTGGPMVYLTRGLAELGWPRVGRVLGTCYAVSMVIGCLGIGNMFQSNQTASILIGVSGGADSPLAGSAWLIGLVLATAVGAVIVGGIRTIAATTARLVPGMALLYVVSALVVIGLNADRVPAAVTAILSGAFSPEGVSGGVIGVMVLGFQRAAFSNEAGLGSAAIAHAGAQTRHAASEGHVALLEPFIDTVVICTLTALVIVTTVYEPGLAGANVEGIELTTRAFANTLPWSPPLLSLAAVLFAYSTMITWSYYGQKAFIWLVGDHWLANLGFRCIFLGFIVIGSTIELRRLIDLSDALVFIVAIPNLLGLYLLAPTVRRELRAYEIERGCRAD